MLTSLHLHLNLRMVPTFATAHTFCASCNGPKRSGFLTAVPPKTEIFCTVYNYTAKADLVKGYWNLKRKLGVTMHFSKIIKLQFVKKMSIYTLFCIWCFLIFSKKKRGYPQFSFWIPIALTKICFSRIVINCAKILSIGISRHRPQALRFVSKQNQLHHCFKSKTMLPSTQL